MSTEVSSILYILVFFSKKQSLGPHMHLIVTIILRKNMMQYNYDRPLDPQIPVAFPVL